MEDANNIANKRNASEEFDIARLLMLQSQFDRICEVIDDDATVVPIKGIALLQTIYAERMDRRVNDIDIVIVPEERLPEAVRRLVATGDYSLEFDYMKDERNIMAKKKVGLKSNSPMLTDVDVHGVFFTKKYFRRSCPEFNADTISRLRKVRGNVSVMDPLDQWLFLAGHACFHMFGDPKWIRDLYLLQQAMSEKEREELAARISEYGFGRVAWSAWKHMEKMFGPDIAMAMPQPARSGKFRRFIERYHSRFRKGLGAALTKRYYEFIHIENAGKRRAAYAALIFPSLSMVSSIYRIRSKPLALLMYPLHILLTLLSLAAFQMYFVAFGNIHGRKACSP